MDDGVEVSAKQKCQSHCVTIFFLREKDNLLVPKTSISTDVISVHQCRKLRYSLSPIAPNIIKEMENNCPIIGSNHQM